MLWDKVLYHKSKYKKLIWNTLYENKLYDYFSFEQKKWSKAPSSPPYFNGVFRLMWMFFQMRYFTACRESIEADAWSNFNISMSTGIIRGGSPSIPLWYRSLKRKRHLLLTEQNIPNCNSIGWVVCEQHGTKSTQFSGETGFMFTDWTVITLK